MEITIRKAHEHEYEEIIHLLASNRLPTSDIDEENVELYIGVLNEEMIATVGIETYGKFALLRSLCVKEGYKNRTIGEALLQFIHNACQEKAIHSLFLLTTTAERYFERFGYGVIHRQEAPKVIQTTREFCSICPSSAIIMQKNLALKE